jgi:hypothetical protein
MPCMQIFPQDRIGSTPLMSHPSCNTSGKSSRYHSSKMVIHLNHRAIVTLSPAQNLQFAPVPKENEIGRERIEPAIDLD